MRKQDLQQKAAAGAWHAFCLLGLQEGIDEKKALRSGNCHFLEQYEFCAVLCLVGFHLITEEGEGSLVVDGHFCQNLAV